MPCCIERRSNIWYSAKYNDIRKAKYTIGMDIIKHFLNLIGPLCFDKFIEINQSLKCEETITREYYMINPKKCRMNFYKTNKQNPLFIEKDMINIGQLVLEIEEEYVNSDDKNNRKIEVTMKFWGTSIDVSVKHIKSGKLVKAILEYN